LVARLVRGGSSDIRYARVTFDRVRARMLEAKAASEEQIDAFDRAFDDPLVLVR
jgi:hypothetical protein